jgi:hypothetical protein
LDHGRYETAKEGAKEEMSSIKDFQHAGETYSTDAMIQKTKCCYCGTVLGVSHASAICLMKEAFWVYPTWGNVYLGWQPGDRGFAIAFLCDDCLRKGNLPKMAVEFAGSEIKYHPLGELKDVDPKLFDRLKELDKRGGRIGG